MNARSYQWLQIGSRVNYTSRAHNNELENESGSTVQKLTYEKPWLTYIGYLETVVDWYWVSKDFLSIYWLGLTMMIDIFWGEPWVDRPI